LPASDGDKDGVIDEEDECTDVPGTAAYKGCHHRKKTGTGMEFLMM